MKICFKCKKQKELCEFGKDLRKKDNLCIYCKPCQTEIRKKHFDETVDKKAQNRQLKWSLMSEEDKQKHRDSGREWARNNYQRRKSYWRIKRLKKEYNLTIEEFDNMLENQEYKCSICKCLLETEWTTNIDHCHVSGKVRSLLCNKCNSGLGSFKDNIEFLEEAIKYLRKHKE